MITITNYHFSKSRGLGGLHFGMCGGVGGGFSWAVYRARGPSSRAPLCGPPLWMLGSLRAKGGAFVSQMPDGEKTENPGFSWALIVHNHPPSSSGPGILGKKYPPRRCPYQIEKTTDAVSGAGAWFAAPPSFTSAGVGSFASCNIQLPTSAKSEGITAEWFEASRSSRCMSSWVVWGLARSQLCSLALK